MATTPDSAQAKAPATLTVARWSPGEDVIEVKRTARAGRRARHLAHLRRDRCAA